jgi:hypothetical protein
MKFLLLVVVVAAAAGCSRPGCFPDGSEGASGEPPNGTCAPEGERFVDNFSCDEVVGPCAKSEATGAFARVEEDAARLEDPDLEWSKQQLEACSCICCHDSVGQGSLFWAYDFGPAWTDSVSTELVERLVEGEFAGFQSIPPAENNGFTRDPLGFPTNDPDRMRAFFERELARRE